MKEIILKNETFRVVKETVTYNNLDRTEVVSYCKYKLQKKGLLFWKTIITHPFISVNDSILKQARYSYINLFRCLNSAKLIG